MVNIIKPDRYPYLKELKTLIGVFSFFEYNYVYSINE